MRDCLELMGEIIAIHLFPEGSLEFSMPFNVKCPSLMSTDVKIGTNAITVDLLKQQRGIAVDSYYNNVPDGCIIMEPGSTISESEKKSTAGVFYSSKVTARTYDVIDQIRSFVYDMDNASYFDVIVVDSLNRVFVIRGSEPSSSVTMSASLPMSNNKTVEIEVMSVNGIIPVYFSE